MEGNDISVGALLANVADEMLEGMQIIGDDWRYLYVNETVAKQGKRSKEELLGKTMMECYPGIEKTEVFRLLERCKKDNLDGEMENEFVYPDGSKGWFQLFIHPIKEGLLIFSIDITSRKKAEMALSEKIEEMNNLSKLATGGNGEELFKLRQDIANLKELAAQMMEARVKQTIQLT